MDAVFGANLVKGGNANQGTADWTTYTNTTVVTGGTYVDNQAFRLGASATMSQTITPTSASNARKMKVYLTYSIPFTEECMGFLKLTVNYVSGNKSKFIFPLNGGFIKSIGGWIGAEANTWPSVKEIIDVPDEEVISTCTFTITTKSTLQGYLYVDWMEFRIEKPVEESIPTGSVDGDKLVDGTVTSLKLGSLSVGAAHIQNLAVGTAKITDAAIQNAKIENLAVTAAKIANATIVTANIADAQITTAKIADANITTAKIADAQITNAKIANATITNAKIALATITTALIGDAQITTAKINDAAITNAKIVSIDAAKLTVGTIDTGKVIISGTNGKLFISDNRLQIFDTQTVPVERVAIGDVNDDGTLYGLRVRGADGTTVLYDENGVYNQGITDGAITNPKIGNGAVLNQNIFAATITGDKLVIDTITAREIATGTITAASAIIADAAITTAKIADAQITTAKIADAQITNAKIVSLDATKITTGYLNAARIDADSITVDKLHVMARNKLNNFANGTLDGWGVATGVAIVTDPSTSGARGQVLKVTTASAIYETSDFVEVDATKSYKLAVSLTNKPAGYAQTIDPANRIHLAFYVYDKDKVQISATPLAVSTRAWGTATTSPYVWSSATGATVAGWRDLEAYLYAATHTDGSSLPLGKNVTNNFRLPINAKYIRVRLINNGNTTSCDAFFYSPTLTEVDTSGIYADQITAGTLSAINIDAVTIKGSSKIQMSVLGGAPDGSGGPAVNPYNLDFYYRELQGGPRYHMGSNASIWMTTDMTAQIYGANGVYISSDGYTDFNGEVHMSGIGTYADPETGVLRALKIGSKGLAVTNNNTDSGDALHVRGKATIKGEGLELYWSGYGPYIDFKDSAAVDYKVRIRQIASELQFFFDSGPVRHAFYNNGTKLGGTIELDGRNLGMSPVDSPQVLIEFVEFDIPLSPTGTKVLIDEWYLKTVANRFAVFTNNGTVIEKGLDYFIVAGTGIADCRIVGERIGYRDVFFADVTEPPESPIQEVAA